MTTSAAKVPVVSLPRPFAGPYDLPWPFFVRSLHLRRSEVYGVCVLHGFVEGQLRACRELAGEVVGAELRLGSGERPVVNALLPFLEANVVELAPRVRRAEEASGCGRLASPNSDRGKTLDAPATSMVGIRKISSASRERCRDLVEEHGGLR